MIKNYLIVAYRNILKNKIYSLVNISGLAIGKLFIPCEVKLVYIRITAAGTIAAHIHYYWYSKFESGDFQPDQKFKNGMIT